MTVDQTIKQRLIGAIVLVAIAVIFLPGILGNKTERQPFKSKIEPTNPAASVAVPADNAIKQPANQAAKTKADNRADQQVARDNQGVSDAENQTPIQSKDDSVTKTSPTRTTNTSDVAKNDANVVTKASPADIASVKQPVKPPVSKPTFKKQSWVIQTGSFESNANARSLSRKLEQQKLKSFVRPADVKGEKIVYRVYVGPWLERSLAEAQLSKVESITRIKPIVVAWDPAKQ